MRLCGIKKGSFVVAIRPRDTHYRKIFAKYMIISS